MYLFTNVLIRLVFIVQYGTILAQVGFQSALFWFLPSHPHLNYADALVMLYISQPHPSTVGICHAFCLSCWKAVSISNSSLLCCHLDLRSIYFAFLYKELAALCMHQYSFLHLAPFGIWYVFLAIIFDSLHASVKLLHLASFGIWYAFPAILFDSLFPRQLFIAAFFTLFCYCMQCF